MDDLLVFAPFEEESLKRLDKVFSHLNQKLAHKKCHLIQKSVKILSHAIDIRGVSDNQEKVNVISAFRKEDLIDDDDSQQISVFSVMSFIISTLFLIVLLMPNRSIH